MSFIKSFSNSLSVILKYPAIRSKLALDLNKPLQFSLRKCPLHTTAPVQALDEFFEVEKFRGEKTIRVGREWR